MTLQSRYTRPLVIGAVMASICMIALEATIVSTAMPQIVADLGGLRFYSWVFSSFLLTQTTLTVVFGNLSDIYGRKPVMLAGVAIFLLGSILAGFAWSMPSMIAFRLIQGVGAGAIQPMAMTIVADLYSARERGKIQGYLASVWAISAVLGPVVGGLMVRNMSWAWVFWINVPIGLIAAAGFSLFLNETARHERRVIDVIGALTFTIAIVSLLIALTEIGSSEFAVWVAIAIFCVSIAAFLFQERRAANPLISFALWSRRPIATTNAVAVLSGMSLIGLTTFVPMYVQIVLQRTPLIAGLALTTMLIGWPVGSTIAARLFHRITLHRLLVTGGAFLPLGAAPFVLLTPDSSPIVAALGSLVMGFGMGLVSVTSLVLIQEIVDAGERGSATASTLFSRNLGSTLGATVLGAVLNHGLRRATGGAPVTSDQLRQLMQTGGLVPGDPALRLALQHSLNLTFWVMFALAIGCLVITLCVPSVELKHAAIPTGS